MTETPLSLSPSNKIDGRQSRNVLKARGFKYILSFILAFAGPIVVSQIGRAAAPHDACPGSPICATPYVLIVLFLMPIGYLVCFYLISSWVGVGSWRMALVATAIAIGTFYVFGNIFIPSAAESEAKYTHDRLIVEALARRETGYTCGDLNFFSEFRTACKAVVSGNLDYCNRYKESKWPPYSWCVDQVNTSLRAADKPK